MISERPQISSWFENLAEKPDGLYKFTGMAVNVSMDLRAINRETYDTLQWLGDIGGLVDALIIIAQMALAPYVTFHLKSYLMRHVFRLLPRQQEAADTNANEAHHDPGIKKNRFKKSFVGSLETEITDQFIL